MRLDGVKLIMKREEVRKDLTTRVKCHLLPVGTIKSSGCVHWLGCSLSVGREETRAINNTSLGKYELHALRKKISFSLGSLPLKPIWLWSIFHAAHFIFFLFLSVMYLIITSIEIDSFQLKYYSGAMIILLDFFRTSYFSNYSFWSCDFFFPSGSFHF